MDHTDKKYIDAWFVSTRQLYEVSYFITVEHGKYYPKKTREQLTEAFHQAIRNVEPSRGREALKAEMRRLLQAANENAA